MQYPPEEGAVRGANGEPSLGGLNVYLYCVFLPKNLIESPGCN